MLSYFPTIKPYATHRIKVEAPHELYVEECGNSNGIPVIFLHDGPGLGIQADDRRFFDPNLYRIILFDQRGCGQSTPHAELSKNTTAALINDIETIRKHLKINKCILFGISWGASLALLYAQAFPNHVLGMILQGLSLLDNADTNWFYAGAGANFVFPDDWRDFLAPLPQDQHHSPLLSYYSLLNSKDELSKMAAAKAWAQWKARCYSLEPNPSLYDFFTHPHTALTLASMECYYIIHNYFIEPDQILRHTKFISNIPTIMVHGRYDMIHPLENAWRLSALLPNSELDIIRTAGHAANDPPILDALMLAAQKMSQHPLVVS
jgi:proline iminopeptidase